MFCPVDSWAAAKLLHFEQQQACLDGHLPITQSITTGSITNSCAGK